MSMEPGNGAAASGEKEEQGIVSMDDGARAEIDSSSSALSADPAAGLDLSLSHWDDSILDTLEITTGHVQPGQVADEAAWEEAQAAVPSRITWSEDAPTPCAFITGCAGTGKTYAVRERCSNDPYYAALSASTGIAAVNLNTVTIHSLLGFFDTDSLRDGYLQGSVQKKLRKLAEEGYRNVVLDECSMVSADSLDLLVRVFDDVNLHRLGEGEKPIGLVLVGDFLQLAAIADQPKGHSYPAGHRRPAAPIPWAFRSQFWPRFAANETRLTKVWRQADQRFLAALNFARSGRGRDCLGVLQAAGQRFESSVDHQFQGTTIVGKNEEVDRINQIRLDKEPGRRIQLVSRRWAAGGKLRTEWRLIPERMVLKEGCYVMILANKYEGRQILYANGDCGWVRGIQPSGEGLPPTVQVELVRTGEVVGVESLVRGIEYRDKPDWHQGEWRQQGEGEDGRFCAEPHYRRSKGKYVTGQVEYFPLRLAYASTVHKSQGLSLDRIQVDIRGWMFKATHAMTYVAMSRCRSLEGLRLVGAPEMLAERCKVDPAAVCWL